MKRKIALLGDSIRLLGYGSYVPELLGEDFEVFQPEDNCRFAKYTLRLIFDLQNDLKDCELIHFNCGLWDVCNLFDDGKLFSTDEEYVDNVMRITHALKKITPKIIFATTTPVHPNYPYNKNSDIERFNSLVVPKLQDLGVQINDLYSLVSSDIEKYISEDKIHLNQEGSKVCAEQIAKVIKKAL